MILAVIPARGGSKRCPGKNLKDFRGKPLIVWTIEAAKQSHYIDTLVVSTDDWEISSLAMDYVPVVMRPSELATDTATNEDVLRHAIKIFPGHDWVVLLQPTSPLRTPEDIDECILLAKQDKDGCISYRASNGSRNGAVYVCSSKWLENHLQFEAFRVFYIMPDSRSLDIDYEQEFDL